MRYHCVIVWETEKSNQASNLMKCSQMILPRGLGRAVHHSPLLQGQFYSQAVGGKPCFLIEKSA